MGQYLLKEGHVYRRKLDQIGERDRCHIAICAMPIDAVEGKLVASF